MSAENMGNASLFDNCKLMGDELDTAVARLLEIPKQPFSSDWGALGPLIEANKIYLDPPKRVHYHGGPNHGWRRHPFWRATVSASVRSYPHPSLEGITIVGRGESSDPRVAICRAIVDSFGEKQQ